MSSNTITRLLSSTIDTVFKKWLVSLTRTIFEYFISFLFVQIPIFCHLDKKNEKQNRIRAKLIHEDDSSSPYRAVEVLDKLQTQPEKKVHTLAVIPDLCLERYADKETMGVREIFNTEEEKQPNGKIYKKVCYFIVILYLLKIII